MRDAFDALFALEDALAAIVARASEPALAAIKLAWWRERLEALDDGLVPGEPRLRAAAAELLPRGVSGRELAFLEEGWSGLLCEPPDLALAGEHGARLFALGARLLQIEPDAAIEAAGRLFALVDAMRRGLIGAVPGDLSAGREPVRRQARPLTALAALAARDLRRGGPPFEPEATPGRALTLLRHRLTGRLG